MSPIEPNYRDTGRRPGELFHEACRLARDASRPDDMCDDCYDLAYAHP